MRVSARSSRPLGHGYLSLASRAVAKTAEIAAAVAVLGDVADCWPMPSPACDQLQDAACDDVGLDKSVLNG